MATIKIDKKDGIVLKIIHYFVTEEEYKPIIINGVENEIWLENMEKDLKIIRININYIHNTEQFNSDLFKVQSIMNSIRKKTFTFNLDMLNLLLDTGESVNITGIKHIESIKVDKINDFKSNKIVEEFFPKIKEATLNDKTDPVEFFMMSDDMNEKTMQKEKKLARIFSPKKPVITYTLLILNVLIFIIMLFGYADQLKINLGNNYLLVQGGQFYRLFTCMFLHADLMHLACNMYALYLLGRQVERYYGSLKYLFIYLVSGLLGSVFSAVFMSANTLSIGASGAIFGLLGSIAYFSYHYRATIQEFLKGSVIPVIVVNLAMGFMIPGIDFYAHIGGLIGGILTSMIIGIGDKSRKKDFINGIIVLLTMFAFMIYFVTIK